MEYLTTSKQRYPESAAYIEEFEESLYFDDLITGDATIEEVQKVKERDLETQNLNYINGIQS